MSKEALYGKTLSELKNCVTELGLPAFTSKQVADWLYKKHVTSIEDMTNLSKKARIQLAEHYEVGLTPPLSFQESVDGTKKYLFQTSTGTATVDCHRHIRVFSFELVTCQFSQW